MKSCFSAEGQDFFYFCSSMAKFIGDRISTEDHKKSTTIVITPKRVLWKEILFGLWCAGFTFAGVYMIYLLAFGGMEELAVGVNFDQSVYEQQQIYLAIFIAFWAYFEYATLKAFLWIVIGRELIMIDTEAVSIKKSFWRYGKSNRFFFENIKNFKYEKPDSLSLNTFLDNSYWSTGSDVFKLDYMGKSKKFGRKLEEKEAKQLFKFMSDRMKKWRKH